METLPPDVLRKIALEMSPPDLIKFCSTEKRMNVNICDSKDFWLKKLEIDYPEALIITYRDGLPLINPKRTYIRKFTEVSKLIESISNSDTYDTWYAIYQDLLDVFLRDGTYADEQVIRRKYNIDEKIWSEKVDKLRFFLRKKTREVREAEEVKKMIQKSR